MCSRSHQGYGIAKSHTKAIWFQRADNLFCLHKRCGENKKHMLGSPVPLLEMRKVLNFWNRKIKSDMLRSNINISDIKTQKENTINLVNGMSSEAMSFWIANIHWVLMCASSLVSTLKSTSLNFKTTLSVDMFTMPTGTRKLRHKQKGSCPSLHD